MRGPIIMRMGGLDSQFEDRHVGLDSQFADRHDEQSNASVAEWLRAWDTLIMFEATVCGRS